MIKRGDPKCVLDELFRNIVEERFDGPGSATEQIPPSFSVDVWETPSHFIVEAELPGFVIENISIEYENGYLSISAQREESTICAGDACTLIRRECKVGTFRRTFSVGDIDRAHIHAGLRNGVLRIDLPKALEETKR